MNYRPITDLWILARAKLKDGKKYFGAWPGGFPERARVLIGCGPNDAVLHVCGGMARHYPYKRGFGVNDKTLDVDPAVEPDFLQDARLPLPMNNGVPWGGIICDPPYSEEDAEHYACGPSVCPKPNQLIDNAMKVLPIGGKAGIIHYVLPRCPKNAKFIACVGIIVGFNNRIRCFSVFEKMED